MEKLTYYEKVKRVYLNGVTVEYEKFSETDIYIHSIHSQLKHQGRGTDALKHFLQENNNCDIYLFASSEHGTDVEMLNKWYKKLGFECCRKKLHIAYNVTHCRCAKQNKSKGVSKCEGTE